MPKSRQIEYDLMRIIASFCVIMIHCPVFGQRELFDTGTLAHQAINIYGVLSRWAVPAFVMLSGMMIIPKREESIKRLMLRRVLRMLAAYIAWSAVYSAYNVFVLHKIYAGTALKTFIDGCFSGELHMWYLPMTAGLYIISPLLSRFVKALDRKWSLYWLAGMFVFSSLIPFVIKLNIKFVSVIVNSISGYMELSFLGGWTLYFVLGYYIGAHAFTAKEKRFIYVFGGAAFVLTMAGTAGWSYLFGHAYGLLPYEYPNIIVMSAAVMVFFKENVSEWNWIRRFEKQITDLSELTFGIFLIHVLLLEILYASGINLQLAHPMIAIPVISLIVFAIGAIIVWSLRKIPFVGRYLS